MTTPSHSESATPLRAPSGQQVVDLLTIRRFLDRVRQRARRWIWVETAAQFGLVTALWFWATLLLDWLIELVKEQRIDALIIAGDIFDTGTPPSYARRLYSRFIVSLQNTPCQQLVVIGGNHDSVATLNESKELLACLNTFVVGGVSKESQDQVLVLKNSQGDPGAVICAIPFVRPRDVLESQAGESGEDKQQALQQAIALDS